MSVSNQQRFYTRKPEIDYEGLMIVGDATTGIEFSMQLSADREHRDVHMEAINNKGIYLITVSLDANPEISKDTVKEDTINDNASLWLLFYDSKNLQKTMTFETFRSICMDFVNDAKETMRAMTTNAYQNQK